MAVLAWFGIVVLAPYLVTICLLNWKDVYFGSVRSKKWLLVLSVVWATITFVTITVKFWCLIFWEGQVVLKAVLDVAACFTPTVWAFWKWRKAVRDAAEESGGGTCTRPGERPGTGGIGARLGTPASGRI